MIELTKPEILGAALTLGSVIIALWKLLQNYHNNQAKRLEKVEQDHENCNSNVLRLTEDVSFLKGKFEGIEGLSNSVLHKLDEINKGASNGSN